MADQELRGLGSVNWLCAQREGEFVRHETSIVYRGLAITDEFDVSRANLRNRVIGYEICSLKKPAPGRG